MCINVYVYVCVLKCPFRSSVGTKSLIKKLLVYIAELDCYVCVQFIPNINRNCLPVRVA